MRTAGRIEVRTAMSNSRMRTAGRSPRARLAGAILTVVITATVGCVRVRPQHPEIQLRACDTIPRALAAVFPARRNAGMGAETGMSGLSGIVADSLTGFALSRVIVRVAGPVERSTTTDSTGAFSLIDLPAGSYQVVVARVGWEPLVRRLTLSRDSLEFVALKLRYEACP